MQLKVTVKVEGEIKDCHVIALTERLRDIIFNIHMFRRISPESNSVVLVWPAEKG